MDGNNVKIVYKGISYTAEQISVPNETRTQTTTSAGQLLNYSIPPPHSHTELHCMGHFVHICLILMIL